MPWLQNIDVPLAGDAAAIQKYADEVEALKKKVMSSRLLAILRLALAACQHVDDGLITIDAFCLGFMK